MAVSDSSAQRQEHIGKVGTTDRWKNTATSASYQLLPYDLNLPIDIDFQKHSKRGIA
jgi:hypothetical protein